MNWNFFLDMLKVESSGSSSGSVSNALDRNFLEKEILPAYLQQARWFGGKSRQIQRVTINDFIVAPEKNEWLILFLRVEYLAGQEEVYLLPVAGITEGTANEIRENFPGAILWEYKGLNESANHFMLCEAIYLRSCRDALLQIFSRREEWPGQHGVLKSTCSPNYVRSLLEKSQHFFSNGKSSFVLKAEQSNTSILYGNAFFFKMIRRLEVGENPDIEILKFLNENTNFKNVPQYYGCLEYFSNQSKANFSIAILQNCVAHKQGGWDYALELAREAFANNFQKNLLATNYAELLGKKTAEMHLALGSSTYYEAFAPELFTEVDYQIFHQKLRVQLENVITKLAQSLTRLEGAPLELAKEIISQNESLKSLIKNKSPESRTASKIRIHGDYHLGQILWTGEDVVILDFEGEPARSLVERTKKNSGWKDVAGMIRSFHYAIHAVAMEKSGSISTDPKILAAPVEDWFAHMKGQFLAAYQTTMLESVPSIDSKEDDLALLNLFIIEKTIYELEYELNNRPAWVIIPLLGILSLLRN